MTKQNASAPNTAPGRSIFGRMAKGALIIIAATLLSALTLIAGVGIWLKTGDVQPVAQWAIESVTDGEAKIGAIDIDFGGALSCKSFFLKMQDSSSYLAKDIKIKADLASLLRGEVRLTNVHINSPKIVYVETDEVDPGGPPPIVPFPIIVESLTVDNLGAEYRVGSDLVRVAGLKLTLAGDAGIDGVYAKLKLTSSTDARITVARNNGSSIIDPKIDLNASFNKAGDWRFEGRILMKLKKVTGPYKVEPGEVGFHIDAKGKYSGVIAGDAIIKASIFSDKQSVINARFVVDEPGIEYSVEAQSVDVDLSRLESFIANQNFQFNGTVKADEIIVSGFLPDDKSDQLVRSSISANGLIALDKFKFNNHLAPKGAVLKFNIENLSLDGEKLNGKGVVNFEYPLFALGDMLLQNGSIKVGVDFNEEIDRNTFKKIPKSPGGGALDIFITSSIVKSGALAFNNVVIGVNSKGDFLNGDFTSIEGKARVDGKANATFQASAKGFGAKSLEVNADITIWDLPWLLTMAPGNTPVTIGSGAITVNVLGNGLLGKDFTRPELLIDTRGKLKNVSVKLLKVDGDLLDSDADILLNFKVGPDQKISDIVADLHLRSKGFTTANSPSLDIFTLDANVGIATLAKPVIDYDFDLNSKTIISKNLHGVIPVSLKVVGSFEPHIGKSEFESVNLMMGKLGNLEGAGSVDEEKRFDITIGASNLDIGPIAAIAMKGFDKPLPITSLGGIVSGDITARGVLPESIVALKKSIPITLVANIKLANGHLEAPRHDLIIDGVDMDLTGRIDKHKISADGGMWIANVRSEKLFGDIALDPTLEFDISLTDLNRLSLERFVLDTPALGFVHYVDGKIDGVRSLITDSYDNDLFTMLKSLDVDINNFVTFTLDDRQKLLIDLDISGDFRLEAALKSTAKEGVRLSGFNSFRRLSIRKGDARLVENLNGSAGFVKSLAYGKLDEKRDAIEPGFQARTKSVRETSFFDDLLRVDSSAASFRVELMELGPLKFAETMFEVNLDESRLGLDYFRTNVLGGGLTGSFHMKSEDGIYLLRTTESFAGIDIQKILKNDLGLSKDEAKVDGSVTVEIRFRSDDDIKELDLNSINVTAHLTRIGSRALDRALLFIDPEESSPAVMNARTLLNYATPTKVALIAKNGNLSLTIDQKYTPLLGGMEVTMPVIKRSPIQGLVNFEVINSQLGKLAALKTVMRIVGATRIEAGPDGELLLR